MQFVWTDHALRRIKQRGYKRARVEEALRTLPEIHGKYEHNFGAFAVAVVRLQSDEYVLLIVTVAKKLSRGGLRRNR